MDESDLAEVIKGQRCGIDNCPSRTYFLENGYYQCKNGHRRHGDPIAGADDENQAAPGQITRRRKEANELQGQLLDGREAFELYLLCYQLILRRLTWVFIYEKGYPSDLEGVIRDLWSLRLTKLHDRIPDDTTDTEGGTPFYSSQSEDDKTSEVDFDDAALRRRGRNPSTAPSLLDAIALSYLGLICLRTPVTVGDLMHWIENGELIYYRTNRIIPENMKIRLPSTYHRMLEPEDILKPTYLQKAVLDLTILYKRDHQVIFPPLSVPPLLFRLLQDMALPIEVYALVPRLAQLVGYTFDFSKATTTRRYRGTDIPEMQLASLIVIAVKLTNPLDDVTRHPFHSSEPAAAIIDWSTWIQSMRSAPQRNSSSLSDAEMMLIKESDVYKMSSEVLDKYLDWYQRTWVKETLDDNNRDTDFRAELLKIFPLDTDIAAPQPQPYETDREKMMPDLKRLRAVQEGLLLVPAISEEQASHMDQKPLRPGELYVRYRKIEEIVGDTKSIYEETAKKTGVALKDLVGAVFRTEEKLSQWQKEQTQK